MKSKTVTILLVRVFLFNFFFVFFNIFDILRSRGRTRVNKCVRTRQKKQINY